MSSVHAGFEDAPSPRAEARCLAEELLGDIELGRIDSMAIVRKASRLARLLDDAAAMKWLAYEATGYPSGVLDPDAWSSAKRSSRTTMTDDGERAYLSMLGQLEAEIQAAEVDLNAGAGDTSSSQYAVIVENNKGQRRNALRGVIADRSGIRDRVVGAIHNYVAERYQELRFGQAVESAFQVVRAEVDGAIAELVPDALPMISAAFENASSPNPEHWQSAASTCRRLLMTAADRLRPSGPDVDGRKMGQGNYINRLVDWIVQQATSETTAGMITADLEYLGPRLDAADQAGQKGAHVGVKPVSRLEASRYVTGTYLVLGDILRIRDATTTALDPVLRAAAGVAPGTSRSESESPDA